ncbi:C40 family peptidase [Paenibacillus sp. TRM 82003]|nr:C40 family peptidase [Paenibacillus sp. TRM 82003]
MSAMKLTKTLSILLAACAIGGCGGNDDAALELQQYLKDEHYLLTHAAGETGDGLPASSLADDPLYRLGDAGIDDPYSSDARRMNGGLTMQARSAPGLAASRDGAVDRILRTAESYIGTPYEYGSDREEPTTFDASDFTHWVVLSALGLDLPRDSRSQAEFLQAHAKRHYGKLSEAKPGDLLFFTAYQGANPTNYPPPAAGTITHVGIYLGDDRMIHTASANTGGVRVDSLSGTHFAWRFALGGSIL